MACLVQLPRGELQDALEATAAEAMPVVVSVRDTDSDAWIPCSSRLLAVSDGVMLLELPRPYGSDTPREFVPGEEMCMTFRVGGDKLLCKSVVIRSGTEQLADGTEAPALRVSRPEAGHLLQRRAFSRVAVPEGELLRAGFSVGSSEDTSPPAAPVWTGRVLDLGAGGMRVAVDPGAAAELEEGTPVYVCLAFGKAGRTVYSNAAVRHVEPRERTTIVGLEFLNLTDSPEGQKTLHFLCEKIQSYQQSRTGLAPQASSGN
ncbi:MAG: flagellar brake protein [Planctomycetota bacterium]